MTVSNATALATELGYDGDLTLGAVEDRARIYQRRTAEDAIELGKCLLIIRELTQRGEFDQRLEMLGIARRTGYRFMQAAAKISKSCHLAQIANKVKSLSSVLELVTQDDEVIEDLAGMDDLDTLTATQLRARVRESERTFEARVNALQTDLNTANDRIKAADKVLPPPFLSREADAQMQRMLSHEAMGAAGVDLLMRMLPDLSAGGEHLPERLMTMHSCLTALLSRVTIALAELDGVAGEHDVMLPERPQMVLSEDMARDYLAAHTGYVETAIELAQKALIARTDVLGRGRGRPVGSGKKGKKA